MRCARSGNTGYSGTGDQSISSGRRGDYVGQVTAPWKRRAVVGGLVIGVALLLLGWVLTLVIDPDGQGANGTGFTYRGEFYGLSGAEVRAERLGDVLDEEVAFQDTTTEVRRITGVSADVAVAALISVPEVGSGQAEQAWLLLSPEPHLAADPWSDAELSSAVQPQP